MYAVTGVVKKVGKLGCSPIYREIVGWYGNGMVYAGKAYRFREPGLPLRAHPWQVYPLSWLFDLPDLAVSRAGLGRVTLLLVGLALPGCPEGSKQPSAACSKPFEQCQLPDGPLGVCQEVDCKGEHVGPCLVCMSQH